ncbi:MAG: hypothetical protein L6R40_002100 [Gallowayella cf. fulva]|nr:MAG: hypothetical protein L6R40_002100 [Xanthomendoza cf. fulva]
MAPQGEIPIAANVLGTIGTVFWCIQLIPQIWYNWKQKKTDGLPGSMMFIWALSAVPFGVYAIVQRLESMDGVFACGSHRRRLRMHPAPSRLDLAVAQNTFDVLGGVQYIVCLLLEAGIFTSHLLFLLRTRSLRRRAKESNMEFDDLPEASKYVFPRPETTTTPAPTLESDGEHELADVEKGRLGGASSERRRSSIGAGRWPSRNDG